MRGGRVLRRLKFFLIFAWAAGLLELTWWHYPVPMSGFMGCAHAALAAGALLFAALLLGRAFLQRFRLYHGSLMEEAGFSVGLGLAAFSLMAAALGAVGALYGWLAWGLIGVTCIACWSHGEALFEVLRSNLRSKHPWEGSSTEIATVLCLALATLAVLALAFAPPTFYDALVYHLSQAQRAAWTGRISPQPDVLFTWLPSLPGPLWSLALVLDASPWVDAAAPALLNVAVFGVLGLMLMDASARLLSERRIWLAPALALTQPILVLSFGLFTPDAWTALYAFLSLDAFLLALGDPVRRSQASWMLLSAGLAGAAVAAKPVAMIHAVALLLMVATLAWKERSWRHPGLLLGGAALFLLPLFPWLLEGALLKGQPFYPFPMHLLGWTLGAGGPPSYYEHLGTFGGQGWRAWVRLPWAAFFDVNSLGGDGHPGFLLLALAPAVLVGRLDRPFRWILFYLAIGCALWALGPHVLRYALCLLPAASLLAAHGILEVETWALSWTWSRLWRGLVLLGLFSGAAQACMIVVMDFDPIKASLGLEAPEDYLVRMGVPQAKVAHWIRDHGGAGSKILVLGDARSAYLPPYSAAASVFEAHPVTAWVERARNSKEVGAIARANGYDFVYFNGAEWTRVLQGGGPAPRYWRPGDAAAQARFLGWLDLLRALPPQDRFIAGNLMIARLP